MNSTEIQWIKECLPEQMVYPYFKDKYALELLSYAFDRRTKISEIKQSKFGKLLHKPTVKKVLAQSGSGLYDKDDAVNYWGNDVKYLRLTIGEWGQDTKWKVGWYQVSRPERNLVVQVNFDGNHDLSFYRFVGKTNKVLFENHSHPIHRKLNTLGWIRLDVDMETGEVLIEEVQTDWIKEIRYYQKVVSEEGSGWSKEEQKGFEKYVQAVGPYLKMWDEMLLSSALHFIKRELGISNIWYHSFESSAHYKMMGAYSLPPKSVYTKLPEKFGFTRVNDAPNLIKECEALNKLVRRGKSLSFYKF